MWRKLTIISASPVKSTKLNSETFISENISTNKMFFVDAFRIKILVTIKKSLEVLEVNAKKENISYVGIVDRYSTKLVQNKDCHYNTDKFPIYVSYFSKRGFFFHSFFFQH